MINIQKIRVLGRFTLVFNGLLMGYCGDAQQLELQTPQGSIVFELIDFQVLIKNRLISAFSAPANDSVTLSGAVPQYMASVQTALPAIPVTDSTTLTPTG